MKVFVTGATGWVGSAVVHELVSNGHKVLGLTRSAEKATELVRAGADIVEGSLDDAHLLTQSASLADAVIHTAFNHDDMTKFLDNAAQDARAIEVLGTALEGTDRPLLVTSGLLGLPLGANETDVTNPASPRKSEATARALAERGVKAATVRLAPSVHGVGDCGFIPTVIRVARETGVSAYPDAGTNCWSGVYRPDAARVFRLALEHGAALPAYHAVADDPIPFKEIASVIGEKLGLPIVSRPREHFGWFAHFASTNLAASSDCTKLALGWAPTGPGLIADLSEDHYYQV